MKAWSSTSTPTRLRLKSQTIIEGRRVTDDATLEMAKMIFAGKINTDILAALRHRSIEAVGLSGVDGNIVHAERRPPKEIVNRETGARDKVDFGHVGDVVQINARLLTVLLFQHTRGREITDYILSVTNADRIASNVTTPLINALESFARMYDYHSAIEDTIVFPAWKASLGEAELEELGAKFEEIEMDHFGDANGFEAAVARIHEIEGSMGMTDLGTFTAPPPSGKPSD